MQAFQDAWESVQAGDREALIITFDPGTVLANISSTGPPTGELLIMQRIFNDWVDEEICE